MSPGDDSTGSSRRATSGGGGGPASGDLTSMVYFELRALAGAMMRSQRSSHTLQPTALVHEAFLKIAQSSPQAMQNRAHFLAVAAKAMRHVLINHAEAKATAKRGSGARREALEAGLTLADDSVGVVDVLAMHEALNRLEALDARKAHVVEAKVFGGLTGVEIAEVLGVSETTVESDWRTAKAWLSKELDGSRRAAQGGSG
ncbi:MAG: ECF-type sigma factor [Phycisphaerales bacterium]